MILYFVRFQFIIISFMEAFLNACIMLLISYDISNDKIRTKFSKFLSKFGFRLQYSVFEINNSDTVLQNITTEIENTYMKLFTEEDSIIIFKLSETCKKNCYGYAKNEDKEFFLVG